MQALFSETQTADVRAPVGGLVDTPVMELLQDDQATISLNVVYDRLGIEKRLGRIQVADVIATDTVCNLVYHYRNRDDSINLLLRVNDPNTFNPGHLYKRVGANWVGFTSGTNPGGATDVISNGNALCTAVQHADDLYIADGGANRWMVRDGTAIERWGYNGIALPAGTNGANMNGSLTAAGVYLWVYTLYNPTLGLETNPSAVSASFTAAADPNDGKNITVPALGVGNWDPRFTKIRLYRTTAGGGKYLFEKEVTIVGDPETVAQTSTLTVSDASLGSEVAFDNDAPPALQYLTLYNKRVFGVNPANPSSLLWSKESNPGAWPVVNAEDVEKDAGDPITGLFVLYGKLYCLKRSAGVFMVVSEGTGATSTFTVVKLTGDFGCISHWSIVVVENWAYWLDPKGAVRFNGSQVENISDQKIRQTFQRFARSTSFGPFFSSGRPVGPAAFGIHDRRPDKQYVRWILTDPDDGFRYHLIFDVSRQSWFTFVAGTVDAPATGTTDRVAALFKDTAGRSWVITGDETGRAFRLDTDESGNPVYTDNGFPFLFDWASRWFGDGILQMLPLKLFLVLERAATGKKNGPLTVSWGFDGDATIDPGRTQQVLLKDAVDTVKTIFPVKLNVGRRWCHRWRFRLQHSAANGDVKIPRFRVDYKAGPDRVRGI